MENKTIFFALVGGVGVGAHLAHEAHREPAAFFTVTPTAAAPILFRQPHGPEPESPGAPLPVQTTAQATTSSTAISSIAATLPVLSLWKSSPPSA